MSVIRERLARIAVGMLFAVGPVIACNADDDFGYGFASSGGFGGSSSSSGAVDGATPHEYCDDVHEALACTSSQTREKIASSCERGTFVDLLCNAHVVCNGIWTTEEAKRPLCFSPALCPAEYTESVIDLCSRPDAISAMCEYEEGTCGCAPVGGVQHASTDGDDDDDGQDAGADGDAADADAGAANDAGAGDADAGLQIYAWKCVTARTGCPRKRPREGSRCVRPITCDYGYDDFEDGDTMDCYNGTWIRLYHREGQ